MANLINVRLNKGDASSLGFRLHGGKDFGTPLLIQKVIGGSPADRAGLMAGDAVCRINNVDVNNLRHKDAQDVILRAGPSFEVAVQRGGSNWKPTVTPVGKLPSPRPTSHVNNLSPVTSTSLAAGRQENIGAIGTTHNLSARPFGGQVNGGPPLVNKQYNSPLPIYSEQSIAETLSAQSEVLSNGVLGVNFKKNEKSYDAEKSAVFRMVQEADNDPRDESEIDYAPSSGVITAPIGIAGLRRVQAPENKPAPATPQLPPGQNICADCERLIVGVFVRIKDKNLHVECFKCSTCGSSLKNVGYYNLNNKLYCDVHAKLAAKNNPPAPNLQPITIPPGGRIPAGTISAALSSHSLPSPAAPLSPSTNYSATPYYSPGTLSSPRPFSTVSAPLSPSNNFRRTSPTPTPIAPLAGRYSAVKPTTPLRENRCVQNTVWPPIQNEPDFPTASPLYFPPPSQVEPIIKKHQQQLEENSSEIENLDFVELEEMNNQNINWYSAEVSNITGRSTAQCTETISDLIGTQLLVDSVMHSSDVRSSSDVRPSSEARPSSDVSVTFTISESQLQQGRSCSRLSSSSVCETTQSTNTKQSISSEQEVKSSAISHNQQEANYSDSTNFSSACETLCKESKTCLMKGQQQSLASIYEKKVKVENTIPHKWESSMVQALTVASDKPYTQSELDSSECFSQIPTKKSTSALASALATAPSEPFNPTKFSSLEVIPLPEETVPYFPPERSVISETTSEQTSETKTTGYKKKTKIDEELFKDLPAPPTEKISLLAALTTAPDRPYSPFSGDVPSHQTEECRLETTKDTESSKLKLVTPSTTTTTNQKKSIQSNTQTAQAIASQQKTSMKRDETKSSNTAIEKVNKSVKFNEQHKKQTESHSQEHKKETESRSQESSSKSQTISKNVQSENVSKVSTGLPPMIQMVRSSFESKNDKVQMEMSCQFLGEPVTTQITEKCLTQSNIIEDKSTEKSAKSKSSEYEKQSKASSKTMEKCNLKSDIKSSSVGFVSNKESNASVISESALLQKATNKAKSSVESTQRVENIDRNISVGAQQSSNVNQQAEMFSKQRVTVIQPGLENVHIPQISFQPVSDDISSNTTFSPRPRSLTPSMISNPPPIIPYYQASLAPMKCKPVESNLLNPATPSNSRSPSPCFGRPASPFQTTTVRPVSPAAGPPPNPLRSHASLSETMYDNRVRDAKSHLQKFIPHHQQMHTQQPQSMANVMSAQQYHSMANVMSTQQPQSMANVMSTQQSQSMASVKSQNFSSTENKCQQSVSACSSNKLASKSESKGVQVRSESKNVDVSTCGNIQTQTTKKVSEEYERSQKSCCLQSEKSSRKVVVQSNENKNLNNAENQNVIGFHITNPQPLKSPFLSSGDQPKETNAEAPQNNIPKKHLIPDSNPSKLPKPIVSCSGAFPTNSASSIKTVTTPNVSQPNVGAGGGRQAGAVGVAPKRGRGILNLAAGPGSRVALCGQCHSHIRGPFITALGKIWCPEHFVCATPSCRRPLQDLGFVEERGQLYCEYCFEQYLAPPCSKCNAKIKGDCLKAIGKNFHPECFNCVYCGKLFGNSPFFLEDCQPYCENDWNELFTTKCFACGFPVEAGDRWVEALNNNYHSQCFNCTMCKKNLEGQSFVAKGGRPFCKNHAR